MYCLKPLPVTNCALPRIPCPCESAPVLQHLLDTFVGLIKEFFFWPFTLISRTGAAPQRSDVGRKSKLAINISCYRGIVNIIIGIQQLKIFIVHYMFLCTVYSNIIMHSFTLGAFLSVLVNEINEKRELWTSVMQVLYLCKDFLTF